jgi:TonB family protein
VFLSSQLVEISQRFQSDVEDLQVLLQEEDLPVGSVECVQELSERLNSDPRFRRDVAFLVRSMLYREQEEPGSMDMLGVLVVAAAGTQPDLETAPRHELLRELLRFVMQQRRPAASPAASPTARPATRAAVVQAANPDVPVAPLSDAMPSLAHAEPERLWRRAHAVWVIALMAMLAGLGAGLVVRRSGPEARRTPVETPIAAASPATSPVNPAVAEPEPEHRVVVPTPSQLKHKLRKPSPLAIHATGRRAEPPRTSAPITAAANTPPKVIQIPEPAQTSPQPAQASSKPVQPIAEHHESAAVTPLSDLARQRSTPAPTASGNVFAHPEAAAASVTSSEPPSLSRPKEPVLIARNGVASHSPAVAAPKPELQGTVHLGSTGTMASNLMYSPEPEYPAEAIAAGVQGEVTVRAVVGPHGNVIEARVVSGPPLLRDAALQAVGRWRYRPYEQDGQAVPIATIAILDFQIPPKK